MDDRGNKRVVVDLDLDARVHSRVTRVLVYDLSIDGCMIEASTGQLLVADDAIELPLPYVGVTRGTLAWAQGRYAGVLFTHRLHAAVVDHLGFKPTPDRGHLLQDRFGRPVLGRKTRSRLA
jgi:hypothetical protein